MQVFIQLEHGPLAGEPGQLFHQHLEGALLLALRAEVQGGVAIISRDAQQRPDQRRRLVQLLGALASNASSLASWSPGSSWEAKPAARSSCATTGWSALLVWYAEQRWLIAMCGSPASFSRRARSSRDLPMPRPARDQDHLAVAVLGPAPALHAAWPARAHVRSAA